MQEATVESPRPPRPALLLAAMAVVSVLIAASCSSGGDGSTSGDTAEDAIGTGSFSIEVDGRRRSYKLHVPASIGEGSAPLLIQLDGGVPDAPNIDVITRFSALGDEKGFAVATPSAVDGQWNTGRPDGAEGESTKGVDDVELIRSLIDHLVDRGRADSKRIYVAGMSSGAMMAGRLACELSDKIAAVALVAGTLASDVASTCRPESPMPILQFHGTADPLVPYAGGAVAAGFVASHRSVIGAEELAELWIGLNELDPEPASSVVFGDLTARTWGRSPGPEVVFYRCDGSGHTWPGGPQFLPESVVGSVTDTSDASATIWEFFTRHKRK